MRRAVPGPPACPGCGRPVGIYEPLWRVSPSIGAELTSWLRLRKLAATRSAVARRVRRNGGHCRRVGGAGGARARSGVAPRRRARWSRSPRGGRRCGWPAAGSGFRRGWRSTAAVAPGCALGDLVVGNSVTCKLRPAPGRRGRLGSWLSRMRACARRYPAQTTVGDRRWPGVVRGPGAEALEVPGILVRCLRREERGHWCAANDGGQGVCRHRQDHPL